jgi:hypothetical protein
MQPVATFVQRDGEMVHFQRGRDPLHESSDIPTCRSGLLNRLSGGSEDQKKEYKKDISQTASSFPTWIRGRFCARLHTRCIVFELKCWVGCLYILYIYHICMHIYMYIYIYIHVYIARRDTCGLLTLSCFLTDCGIKDIYKNYIRI